MNCPFCDQPLSTPGGTCDSCRRPSSAPRRKCQKCAPGWIPKTESACPRCHAPFRSDLHWRIPVVILLLVAGTLLSILVQFLD
jgi:uncharacterized paraquat-inducible protein A